MDFFKRAAVAEDSVQYRLFLLRSEPLDVEEKRRFLLRLLEDVVAEVAPLLVGYIWQKQAFNLSFYPEKGGVPAHLGGSTEFGDNVEDEWFIVYLLKRITHTFGEVAAGVQDNDGQFLLIEAAEYLPKWLDPDSSENRVFLYHGELHILPDRVCDGEAGWPRDSAPSLREALEVLHTHAQRCRADRRIRAAVERRIQGYPDKIRAGLHRAHCYVPVGVAVVLSRRPDLVAPAVSSFYLRDPVDLQACRTFRTFSPESRVFTSVTFTRCLYAQLQQQSFVPDRRSGFSLPPPSLPRYRAHELGMKLAHGFEILCSKSSRTAPDSGSPVSTDPLWRGFLDSLKRNDYFKGELEGSVRYRELLTAAQSFFKRSLPSANTCVHAPGVEVLQVLESAPYSLEELKQQEAHLPPEDDDDWLNITPDDLERLLEERGGQRSSKGQGVTCGAGRSEDEEKQQEEEEAGFTLVAVTQGMKDFINATSSHEGAEFPRACWSEPFSFEPDALTGAVDRLLGGKDQELDSDDLDDEDDEDDDDDDEEVEASEEQAGTLDSLRRYMDEMDLELQRTNIGQSFTNNNNKDADTRPDATGSGAQATGSGPQGTRSGPQGTGSGAQGTGSGPQGTGSGAQGTDDFQPLDLDVNLVTNLLESLSSQAGLSGPASNLLHCLGLRLPPNADPS